ncbi:MAG TPA: cation:proton antiporter regulatory subunit [Acidimicrobiales bacterium]|nr:cation:proton antiporter regulatory subunit [Acidimicrobiales bacterium]
MTTVRETPIPGLGIRYELDLESGRRIGVVAHRSGRRELVLYSQRDPDAVEAEMSFTPEECKVVADLLGGTRLLESLGHLQQRVEGLAIDWVPIPVTSPFAGRTIGDAEVRTRTGVSIVAVIRGDDAFPAPGPDFVLEADDTVVVVGTPEGIAAATALLSRP